MKVIYACNEREYISVIIFINDAGKKDQTISGFLIEFEVSFIYVAPIREN